MNEEQKNTPKRVAYRKDGSGGSIAPVENTAGSLRWKIIIIASAAAVLLGVGVFVGAMLGKRDGGTQSDVAAQDETASEQSQETEAEMATDAVDAPLEENAHPEINALIEQYYKAAAAGDTEAVSALRDSSEQTELLQIQEKSRYLEAYEDINCYTKPGPDPDSYVVYVTYYARFRDVEQRVCGLNTYMVCRNENGYYIHDCTGDEAMREYRINVTKQDDVMELFNRIQVEYNETVTENEELAVFLADLEERLVTAVGDALAEAQTETPEENAEEQPEAGGDTVQPARVRATDVVNIRKSDSETADKLGKAQLGEEFALLESKANGWSRIRYGDQDAFIKSEFLEPVAAEAEGNDSAAAPAGDGGNDSQVSAAGEQSASTGVPDSGKYRLTETVNVRKSASETADKLGVGFPGDEVEIVMKQADGWTRVTFNGQTGYIKTEVLK